MIWIAQMSYGKAELFDTEQAAKEWVEFCMESHILGMREAMANGSLGFRYSWTNWGGSSSSLDMKWDRFDDDDCLVEHGAWRGEVYQNVSAHS